MKLLFLPIILILLINPIKGFIIGRTIKIEIKYSHENNKTHLNYAALNIIHEDNHILFCFLIVTQFVEISPFLTKYEITMDIRASLTCIVFPIEFCSKSLSTCYIISEKSEEVIIFIFEEIEQELLFGLNAEFFNNNEQKLVLEKTNLNELGQTISIDRVSFIKQNGETTLNSFKLVNLYSNSYDLKSLLFCIKLYLGDKGITVTPLVNKLEGFIEGKSSKLEEFKKLRVPKTFNKFFKEITSPTSKFMMLLKSSFNGHSVGSFIRDKWVDYVNLLGERIDLDINEECLKSLFSLFFAKLLFVDKYENRQHEVYECLLDNNADMSVTFKELKLFRNKSYKVEKALLSDIDALKKLLKDIEVLQSSFNVFVNEIKGKRRRKLK
jgi:hypothetical protein